MEAAPVCLSSLACLNVTCQGWKTTPAEARSSQSSPSNIQLHQLNQDLQRPAAYSLFSVLTMLTSQGALQERRVAEALQQM